MDKIDIVISRYKSERVNCKEFSKIIRRILVFMAIILILYLITVWVFVWLKLDKFIFILTILCICEMLILNEFIEGKMGTKKWKEDRTKAHYIKYKKEQEKLVRISIEEGIDCQQLYNILVKRYDRIIKGTQDKMNFVAIASLVIAFVSILVPPLQNVGIHEYSSYIGNVIAILIIVAPIVYFIYWMVGAEYIQYDKRKKDYERVLKLLEAYLYYDK